MKGEKRTLPGQAGVQGTGPGCLGPVARTHCAWEIGQEPRVKAYKFQLSQMAAIGVSRYPRVGEKQVRDRQSCTGTE